MKPKQINQIVPEVNLVGQLADLKDVDYKNMLVLTGLIEVLIDKGIINRKEILQKADQLDVDLSILNLLE